MLFAQKKKPNRNGEPHDGELKEVTVDGQQIRSGEPQDGETKEVTVDGQQICPICKYVALDPLEFTTNSPTS